jgi:flagellar L-ring protein precursor FlgH
MRVRVLSSAALAAALPILAAGCGPKNAHTDSAALTAYVDAARAEVRKDPAPDGSLWVSRGRRSDLYRDPKAYDVNDIVTIRVLESTSAIASADAKASRESETFAGASAMFGLEGKIKELPNLVTSKGSNTYSGEGSTTRQTTLQTTLSARVVEVLPNGYLVVEGAREVRVNNENQTVYLNGVVRPEDISRDNIVLSSSVAQMTVRVQGKGVVSQPLKPGWLQRIFFGVLPF